MSHTGAIRPQETAGRARCEAKMDGSESNRSVYGTAVEWNGREVELMTPWGDAPIGVNGCCRIAVNNVNGISALDSYVKARCISDSVRKMGIDIVGLVETNLDWEFGDVAHDVKGLMQRDWKNAQFSFSASTKTGNSAFLPGGTMMAVRAPWAAMTKMTSDCSGMGRWTEATICGVNGEKVTIFTVYRVAQSQLTSKQVATAFLQQWEIMRERGVDNPNPRRQCLIDLKERLLEIDKSGSEAIVLMDANESTLEARSELAEWVGDTFLVDALEHVHGVECDVPTYDRGTKRIDYIFVSGGMLEYVEAAGILPLGQLVDSDHRALFIDVDLKGFMRGQPSTPAEMKRRGVNSADPRALTVYREMMGKFLDESGLEEQLEKVVRRVERNGGTLSKQAAKQLDKLEDMFTNAKLEADAACAKIPATPWSPKLIKSKMWVNYWKLWHLVAKAAEAAKQGNEAAEKAIVAIRKAEESRTVYARLRRLMGKDKKGGLSHVLVEKDDGRVECVHDLREINALLLERNRKHFSQADGTPFTTAPLVDLFGRYGTNRMSEALLEGGIDVDKLDVDEATRKILKELRRFEGCGKVKWHLTAEDLRSGYKVWREPTSTSPSGLHLGHEKALFEIEKIECGGEGPTLAERIFEIKAKFLNLAIEHCHVYARWKKVINAMLEKIPGKPLLHKLRVIHIIESDFNLMIGINFGRRMMWNAEKAKVLGDEQDGSRKRRKAQDVLVRKHATLSVLRLSRSNAVFLDNDAKSCYDRIVMLMASLCCQSIGMDKKACRLFLKTLDSARYHVKTQLGVSQEFYSTTREETMHGPGQGGRGSPSIWIAISCLLMKCLQEKSMGCELANPLKDALVKFYSTGFVDDVTLWICNMARSLEEGESMQQLVQEMSTAAQWWEQLLHSTGGKLELPKCFYCVVYWIFEDSGEARLALPDEISERCGPIKIVESGCGSEVEIRMMSPLESHRTLGAMEAPDGNYGPERDRLKAKSAAFLKKVRRAKLSVAEAYALHRSYYVPSMAYSLVVGTLTLGEACAMQSAVVRCLLPAMGFCRNTPSAIVFGPESLGGVGLRHLFTEQGVAKLGMILEQVRLGSVTGKTLIIQLEWAQRVAGRSRPILEEVASHLPQLAKEEWILTLREFLRESQLGVRINSVRGVEMRRQGDRALMDLLDDEPFEAFTDSEIQMINLCRVALRVETISDVADETGEFICGDAYDCEATAMAECGDLWPWQSRPGEKARKVWKAFLSKLCHCGTLRLRARLGRWSLGPTDKLWAGLYDFRNKIVYRRYTEQGPYEECGIINQDGQRWSLVGCGRLIQRPMGENCANANNFVPVQVKGEEGMTYSMSDPSGLLPSASRGPKFAKGTSEWECHIQSLPEWERNLVEYAWECDNCENELQTALCDPNSMLNVASDGGCIGNNGSFAWVIASGKKRLWRANGYAQGGPMSSYRAEAFGKLSWLVFLRVFCDFHSINPTCKIQHCCDNQELIKQTALWTHEPDAHNEPLQADYDVLVEIRAEQGLCASKFGRFYEGVHVKGHQDRIRPFDELELFAQLNVEADLDASRALADLANRDKGIPMTQMPRCPALLLCGGDIVSSKELSLARWRWPELILQDYYAGKMKVEMSSLHGISWVAARLARQKMTAPERTYQVKLGIGWLATGARMEMYGSAVTRCHRCGDIESNDHLFTCSATEEMRIDFIHRLDRFLQTIKTDEGIKQEIVVGLFDWMQAAKGGRVRGRKVRLRKSDPAVIQQGKLGWNWFLRGMIVSQWCSEQENALRNTGQRWERKGDSWGGKLVLWLVREARDTWLLRNNELFNGEGQGEGWVPRHVAQINERVIALYGRKNVVSAQDQVIFEVPLEQRLQTNWRTLQCWVDRMERVVRICAKEVEKNAAKGLQDLRAFGINGANSEEAVAARIERSQRARAAKTPRRKREDGRNLVGQHESRAASNRPDETAIAAVESRLRPGRLQY
jgi:exonuclease III